MVNGTHEPRVTPSPARWNDTPSRSFDISVPKPYDTQYHSEDAMHRSDQRLAAPATSYSINPETPVKLESAGAADAKPS